MNFLPNHFKLTVASLSLLYAVSLVAQSGESFNGEKLVVRILRSSASDNCFSLSLENITNEKLYVANWDMGKGDELSKSLFKILSPQKKTYMYIGKLIKRTEPKAEELVYIPPHQQVVTKINVSEYYDIYDEIYQIWYEAFVPIFEIDGELVRLDGFESLVSNVLTIEMTEGKTERRGRTCITH